MRHGEGHGEKPNSRVGLCYAYIPTKNGFGLVVQFPKGAGMRLRLGQVTFEGEK